MHLGRFNAAIQDLSNYFENIAADGALSKAQAQLQTYTSNKDASHLTRFREIMHELANRAEAVPSSFLLPSVIALHEDLHIEELIGQGLANRIRATMTTPGMVAEEVFAAVTALQGQIAEVTSNVNDIASRLRAREVELVTLAPEEAEFGIAFPPELVGCSAKDLIFEVSHLNRLFMTMNEMLGRGTESPKVRTIAASWWQFFFELDAAQVALWTVALERIINLIKTGYEIRKIKQDLESKKDLVPANFIPDLEAKLLDHFRNGVAQLAQEMRAKVDEKGDKGRANELEISLKQELLHLVRRVNGGAVLEIRLGLPNPPEESAEETEAETPEAIAREEHLLKINEVSQLNEKLAALSHTTVQLEIREDLLLEAPHENPEREGE